MLNSNIRIIERKLFHVFMKFIGLYWSFQMLVVNFIWRRCIYSRQIRNIYSFNLWSCVSFIQLSIRIIQQFSVLQPPKFSYQTNAKLSIQREKKIGADVEFRAIILRWNPDRGQESHVSFVEEDSFVLQENKRGNEIVGTMILLTSSKILISLHPSNFSVFLPQLFSV